MESKKFSLTVSCQSYDSQFLERSHSSWNLPISAKSLPNKYGLWRAKNGNSGKSRPVFWAIHYIITGRHLTPPTQPHSTQTSRPHFMPVLPRSHFGKPHVAPDAVPHLSQTSRPGFITLSEITQNQASSKISNRNRNLIGGEGESKNSALAWFLHRDG